jgi:hypothetical protein
MFYCDVLSGKIMKADAERDFLRLGENFFIGFLYGDVTDESEFLRTARSVWLEFRMLITLLQNIETRLIQEVAIKRKPHHKMR